MSTHFVKTERGQLLRRVPKRFRGKKDRHNQLGHPNAYGPRKKAGVNYD